jgi:hypothetical protein
MHRFWTGVLLVYAAWTADPAFDLAGRLHPEERASVTIFGDAFPFTASTLSEEDGRFQFKKLRPGPYTVSIYTPDRGEARKTIEIGPSAADAHGRISLDITFQDSDFALADSLRRRHSVSTARLAIPAKAQRDYEDAHRDLTRHDADGGRRLRSRRSSSMRGTSLGRSPIRPNTTTALSNTSARRWSTIRRHTSLWSTWAEC